MPQTKITSAIVKAAVRQDQALPGLRTLAGVRAILETVEPAASEDKLVRSLSIALAFRAGTEGDKDFLDTFVRALKETYKAGTKEPADLPGRYQRG